MLKAAGARWLRLFPEWQTIQPKPVQWKMYESLKGYRETRAKWTIPAEDRWHERTWTLSDANFVGQWGCNFRFDANGSPSEFLIKDVRVTKSGPPKQ
jgi:hypothetical protein